MNKLWGVWEVTEKIGQGSFGEVYKSQKTELGKTFYAAIKHISLPKEQSEINDIVREGYATTSKDVLDYYQDTIDDLVKEIEIMYELRANKNIVDYQDHLIVEKTNGKIGFDIFIRMELLTSLDRYIESNDLKEEDIIKLGKDIATALVVCNKHNLLHRDIKPANIFIDDDKTFKLGDFGVARKLEKTTYGMSKKGTYNYMSPEIYKGDRANISSDIYSLGIVMYRLLNNNRAPFIDKNAPSVKASEAEEALMRRMQGEELPDIPDVNKDLMKVIKKASAFYQKDRYKTPEELLDDLKKLQEGKSVNIEDKLDKTVSVYDDNLDKTVSVYDNDLDKTVSVYAEGLAKTGNYESDEELRNRIRKIMEEEAKNTVIKGQTKYTSIKTYTQSSDKKLCVLAFITCVLLFIFNIYILGHYKTIIDFPHGLTLYKVLSNTLLIIVLTDLIVLGSFITSLFSRKLQKISSYGYLINIIIYIFTFIYIELNNCRVTPLFFGLVIFQIVLFYINYRWTLKVKTIDVEEEKIEFYKERDKKLEDYYKKPYLSKKVLIITIVIFVIALASMVFTNMSPIPSQENGRDYNKKQIQIVNDYINIREEPNSSSDKIGMVYKGEIYTVLDKKESSRGDTYYHIETNFGTNGYIIDEEDWIKQLGGK